jgi:O-antigen/teichoic acid export membrane protein
MLIRQAGINLAANVMSALLGLSSVSIFTRLFSPHDYGTYLLSAGFAAVVSVFMVGWFRNLVLSGHARNDGTDVRGLVLAGYLLCCLTAPVAYGAGLSIGLDGAAVLAAIALAIAVGLFELTQDMLRVRLEAVAVMKATLVRAVAVLGFGVTVALLHPTGLGLLMAATLAAMVAMAIQARRAWGGTAITFDRAALAAVARQGLPLTLSLTLLAISGVTDRFMIANLVGAADAGKYVAALDLVRQTLMIPAISAAAAFFPIAVQIHANKGSAAVRAHLADCSELLLGLILPASLGLAVIAPHVANMILGADFRDLAAQTMPIIAIAVVFQIMTQQYLHASFLLSGRNSFYLINTASIIAANVALSYILVSRYGTVGAAWARLGADAIGFLCALILSRIAFRIPLPFSRLSRVIVAALAMALTVGAIDRHLPMGDVAACVALVGTGVVSCAAMYWLLDIARLRDRLKHGLALFRTTFPNTNTGS